jgi:hypothetical protein
MFLVKISLFSMFVSFMNGTSQLCHEEVLAYDSDDDSARLRVLRRQRLHTVQPDSSKSSDSCFLYSAPINYRKLIFIQTTISC